MHLSLLRRSIYVAIAVMLALLGVYFTHGTAHAASAFFVSPSGDNTNGTSWAHAWHGPANINWTSVANAGAGSSIQFDGGSTTCATSPYNFNDNGSNNPGVNCGQSYPGFTVGANNVTLEPGTDSGHNGTVVFDGGRNLPLPYCAQSTYTGTQGTSTGIAFGNHSGVVLDGLTRSGIEVRGFVNGIDTGTGGSDTVRNVESFDNGNWSHKSFGYTTDGNGVILNGNNNTFDRVLVHDNGQDELHSNGGSGTNINNLTVVNSWLGALRPDPTYPGEPFNDIQASGHDPGCQHADSIQIFNPPTTESGITLDHDILGPGVNQGLYPSDSGTGTLYNNVTVTNTTLLAAGHNIISDHNTSSAANNWDLENDTFFAPQGGSELPLATSGGHATAKNDIKYGGYIFPSNQNSDWTTSGNVWFNGDPFWGTGNLNANPGFTHAPSGTLPSLASLMDPAQTDLTPTTGIGSPLHTFPSILDRIDSLNGTVVVNTVTVTNPGNQTGTVSTPISNLTMNGTDSDPNQTLTWSATGLPSGLSINSAGVISGTPDTAATYNPVVTATDGTGVHGDTTFAWTVNPAGAVAPDPAPIWGCHMPDRSLQDIYTNPGNFVAFLNANGGVCPGGGTAIGVGYTP